MDGIHPEIRRLRNYRFFDQCLYLKYHLRRLILHTEKRIISTATSDMKTMRSASLMKQYSFLISNVLKCTQMANFALRSSNLSTWITSPSVRAIPINLKTVINFLGGKRPYVEI